MELIISSFFRDTCAEAHKYIPYEIWVSEPQYKVANNKQYVTKQRPCVPSHKIQTLIGPIFGVGCIPMFRDKNPLYRKRGHLYTRGALLTTLPIA